MIRKFVWLSGCMLMAAGFLRGEMRTGNEKGLRSAAVSTLKDTVAKAAAPADTSKTKTKKDSVKKEKSYDALLKNPKKTAKGLMNLYYVKEKLYLEVPFSLMGKDMLLASTISEISDNGDGLVGSKPVSPMLVRFARVDSSLLLTKVDKNMIAPENENNLVRALDKNTIGAIVKLFDIKAYNQDTTAAVIDVTDYFVGDTKELSPFGAFSIYRAMGYKSSESFKKDRSFLTDIKSFKDNVSIRSSLSYENTLSSTRRTLIKDKPFTVVMTRTFLLLPQQTPRPRIADPRIGVFAGKRYRLSNEVNKTEEVYYAYRWNLVPKDKEAYKHGRPSEPLKPIVFYVDSDFPSSWRNAVKAAVSDWNVPFEKAGFKNAVVVRDYPVNDPEFDPDNLKYNCIRYSPVPVSNIVGPAWVDPRSGEIINASVYVFHDLVKLITQQLFIQTSQADKAVRTPHIPDGYIQDGIRAYVRRELGHGLGFTQNLAASAGIPVDSLRSASFTKKYGTTYSIMDNAHFNYVAQPGDKQRGVKLTEPLFGPYDYLLVKWNYSFFGNDMSPAKEIAALTKMISEKAGDIRYRYGKSQGIDPGVLSGDLGDDPVKASACGIANLKYIMANLNNWVSGEDKDYSFRKDIWDGILDQYVLYLNFLLPNIGGIYINEKYQGDPRPFYQPVPRKKQEATVQFLLSQIKDAGWIENKEVLQNLSLTGTPAALLRSQLMDALLRTPVAVNLAAIKSKEQDAYTPERVLDDIYQGVWGSVEQGKIPDNAEREMQKAFVTSVIGNTKLVSVQRGQSSQAAGLADFSGLNLRGLNKTFSMNAFYGKGDFDYENEVGINGPRTEGFDGSLVNFNLQPSLESVWFTKLTQCRELMAKALNTVDDRETAMHYRLLMNKIDKALNL